MRQSVLAAVRLSKKTLLGLAVVVGFAIIELVVIGGIILVAFKFLFKISAPLT
jgi:hypothetical protein